MRPLISEDARTGAADKEKGPRTLRDDRDFFWGNPGALRFLHIRLPSALLFFQTAMHRRAEKEEGSRAS
jgi:hypothetical protein